MREASPGHLELSTELREAGDGAVEIVRAQGEIDLSNAEQLGSALASPQKDASVLLDLTGVPFMDSSGLRALLVAARPLASRLAVVVRPGSPVLRLFELSGVAGRIPTFEDEQEALEAPPRPGPRGRAP